MLRALRARLSPTRAKTAPAPGPDAGAGDVALRSKLARAWNRVLASYDAAATTEGNQRHWAHADGASADAAMNVADRKKLRERARYECMNNSYMRGIVNTLANDCIGTGPRLQMLLGDKAANAEVERAFARWCMAVGLADKLRIMRAARAESGEVFAMLTTNAGLDSRVKLDLRLVEADQVSSPDISLLGEQRVDGIVFDSDGNPTEYHVLRTHPGDLVASRDYDRVPAEGVIHYFRADRPGQSRGVPEIAQAIPLCAMLRRYTLATVNAAEIAALFAAVLYTDSPAGGEADPVVPGESLDFESRAMLSVPSGWRAEQMKAEQPTTTYGDFKRELLNEIARCISMPYNVAAGNSSTYNYASGRLDFQMYDYAIRVDRRQLERVVLDRVLRAFLREAVLVSGLLSVRVRTLIAGADAELPDHQWFWDSRAHVDPSKEATAQKQRLENGTTNLAKEYAHEGLDWEAETRQRVIEQAAMRDLYAEFKLPIPPAGSSALVPAATKGGDDDSGD